MEPVKHLGGVDYTRRQLEEFIAELKHVESKVPKVSDFKPGTHVKTYADGGYLGELVVLRPNDGILATPYERAEYAKTYVMLAALKTGECYWYKPEQLRVI